jgi:hypothetical protein
MNLNYNDIFELQLVFESYWNKAVQGRLEVTELEELLKKLEILVEAYKTMG